MLRDRDPGRRPRPAWWLVPALLPPGLARAGCGLPQRRGELQVRVGATLAVGARNAGEVARRFAVTAQPHD